MKNEDTKRVLTDLKRQIEGLNYYLADVKVIEEDRKSKQQLHHAKQTVRDIENRMERNLRDLDRDMRQEQEIQIDEAFKASLGSVNSPTETMQRDTSFNMKIRQSGFNRRNILKEASDNFIKMIKTAGKSANEKRAKANDEDRNQRNR